MGSGTSILYIVGLLALMWFLLFRPQQQQAKKRNEMLKQMQVGSKIVTIGGICGSIKAMTDTKIFLEIAEGLTIEMLRTSIAQLDNSTNEVIEDDEEDDDDDLYYDEDEDEADVIDEKK